MATEALENLRVYRAAEELSDAVWDAVAAWDGFAKNAVGLQLVRAADSIGANIAEGYGRASFADNRRFVAIARGSLMETRHFLRRAHRRNLLTTAQTDRLRALLDPLPKQLNAYLKSIGRTQMTSDH
ncbi:MAG: four helix bundle protein [Terrimicrobiaceae bacterium]|nr:four helix bundle protein [Terrimicrobiaceae bacterium]